MYLTRKYSTFNFLHVLLALNLVSFPNLAVKHGQCSVDEFSYHDLSTLSTNLYYFTMIYYLFYRILLLKSESIIILQRNVKAMYMDILKSSDTNWTSPYSVDSIDHQVIVSLLQTRAKRLPSPWLTANIKAIQVHKEAVAKHGLKRTQSKLTEKNMCLSGIKAAICVETPSPIHPLLCWTSLSVWTNVHPGQVWKF